MGKGATAEKQSVTREDLENLDYFEDLQERYMAVDGLSAEWLPKDGPAPALDRDACMRLHYLISLARAVEETLDSAFRAGHVPGTAFFGRGNEAASTASAFCLRDEEWLVPMHRNCGAHLAKGHPARSIMAHFFGRKDGPSAGRDGNFHMGYRPKKITQLISHIGTMTPIAAGLAFAEKYRGSGRAVLTYMGDGGMSTGDVHEAMNLAGVQKLPLVLIVDNNQYAYKTPIKDQFACETLALRAPGYGMPGFLIDGTDAVLVHKITSEALDRARAGGGPTLIESITMRISGHSVYDKYTDYVDMDLFKKWTEERDPLQRFDAYLTDGEIASPEEIAASHESARADAEVARDEALQSPFPDPGKLEEDIFAE